MKNEIIISTHTHTARCQEIDTFTRVAIEAIKNNNMNDIPSTKLNDRNKKCV